MYEGFAPSLVGSVNNPASIQNSDGGPAPLIVDHNGAAITRALGGKRYAAAARGNVYTAGSVIAGVTLIGPIAGTTLASTAGLINPAGSNRLVELISVSVSTLTIDVALKPFALGIQINPSANGVAPTAITNISFIDIAGLSAVWAASPLNGTAHANVTGLLFRNVSFGPVSAHQPWVCSGVEGTRVEGVVEPPLPKACGLA